jgi:uncharacterized protein (DUF2147 family)
LNSSIYAAIIIASASALARAASAGDYAAVSGEWARGDGLVRARVVGCGEALCATNTWVRNPAGDEQVGDVLIMNLHESQAGHWAGPAFDKKRQKTYQMQLNVAGDHMTTRGCVLGGLICRGVDWTRYPN